MEKRHLGGVFGILISVWAVSHSVAYAQERNSCADARLASVDTCRADFHVDFRWDSSVLDTAYMENGKSLHALADSLASIDTDRIDSLRVFSYSSPEGRYGYNVKLSERRAAAMRAYLDIHYPHLLDRVHVVPDGEAWHLFRERVLADSSITETEREHILSVIDSQEHPDRKKALIKNYDRKFWNRMVKTDFVDMRRSFIRLSWNEDVFAAVPLPRMESLPFVEAPMWSGLCHADSIGIRQVPVSRPVQNEVYQEESRDYAKKTVLALKTNLLYDAVTALNFELEIPVGDRFSIAVEDVFPWWNWGPNGKKYCFQMWEMGIEPRWWFLPTQKRDRLSGHFLGVYGMSSKYDFQWDTDLCWQGEYWSAGVSYGYSLPVGKVCNFEFSASVGFMHSDWRHYQPDAAYEHLYRDPAKTGVVSYFGPTKLKVSLVVPIRVKYRRHAK